MYPDPQIIPREIPGLSTVREPLVDSSIDADPAWSEARLQRLRSLADLPLADLPMTESPFADGYPSKPARVAQSVPPPVGDPIAPDPYPPNPVTPEPIQPGPGDPVLPGRPEMPEPGPAQRPLGFMLNWCSRRVRTSAAATSRAG